MRRIIPFALAVVFAASAAQAQGTATDAPLDRTLPAVWLDAGLGYGGAGGGPETERGGHLAGRTALSLAIGRTVFIARATATTGGPSPYGGGLFSFPDRLHDEFIEVGLLVGYRIPLGATWEGFGAGGLALVSGTRAVSNGCRGLCWSSGTRESFTPQLGLPLEVGLSVALSRAFRLGAVGYANLNAEELFGGILALLAVRLQ
jgi:hypothetical protein